MSAKIIRSGLALCAIALFATAAIAQTGTLFVQGDKVGLYKATPAFGLDILNTDASKSRIEVTNNGATANRTLLKLVNNGFPRFLMRDAAAGVEWLMTGGSVFIFGAVGTGINEMVIAPGGNVTIGGNLTQGSSRSIKSDFVTLDSREILDRLAEVPLQEWRYNHDSPSVRHFGPFSEDFYAAFGLGASATGISALDASGVTMAAVQGLYEIVREKEVTIETLRSQNDDLERRLIALEQAMTSTTR